MKYLKIILALLLTNTLLHASEEAPTQEEIAKLYVATFNRAPDSAGLDYWTYHSGLRLSQIAQSFFDQPETQTLYPPETSNRDFIKSVYTNLFNREPDQAGWDYWENELNTGAFSKNRFIEAVINGAQDTEDSLDITILSNKTTVGLYFSDAGLEDTTTAKTVMEGITADTDTVDFILVKINDEEIAADVWSGYTGGQVSNSTPIAVAGANKTSITENENVTFSAIDSSDSDGSIVSYEWRKDSTLLSTEPSFSTSDLPVGTNIITLTVTDNQGLSNSNSITISKTSRSACDNLKHFSRVNYGVWMSEFYQPPSSFNMGIQNDSSITYNVSKLVVKERTLNGLIDYATTTSPSLLSNNTLSTGEYISVVYSVNERATRGLVFIYTAIDPVTHKEYEIHNESFSSTGGTVYPVNSSTCREINSVPIATVVNEQEYNDDYTNATLFNLSGSATGFLSTTGDADWYAVDIFTNDMVFVKFMSSSYNNIAYWSVSWYDPNMNILSERNIDKEGFSYSFPAFTPGRYYLRIKVTNDSNIFYDGSVYTVTISDTITN